MYGKDDENTWASSAGANGSVQGLDFLSEEEKEVFKTAIEIDQRFVIRLAADRQPFLDQSQSVNLFLPADVSKRDLHGIHMKAWQSGLKGLYYCRSLAVQRAEHVSKKIALKTSTNEECEVCQ